MKKQYYRVISIILIVCMIFPSINLQIETYAAYNTEEFTSSENIVLCLFQEKQITTDTLPLEELENWSSGNVSVAVVDQNGLVKAVGEGFTTIEAELPGEGKLIVNVSVYHEYFWEKEFFTIADIPLYNCADISTEAIGTISKNSRVEVLGKAQMSQPIFYVRLDDGRTGFIGQKGISGIFAPDHIMIRPDESTSIDAVRIVSGITHENPDILWVCDDPLVARVTHSGDIFALSPGRTFATLITKDGNEKHTILISVMEEYSPMMEAVIKTETYLTQGADSEHDIIKKVEPGTVIDLIGWCGGWNYVKAGNDVGFISSDSFSYLEVDDFSMVVEAGGETSFMMRDTMDDSTSYSNYYNWKVKNTDIATLSNEILFGVSEGITSISITRDDSKYFMDVFVSVYTKCEETQPMVTNSDSILRGGASEESREKAQFPEGIEVYIIGECGEYYYVYSTEPEDGSTQAS